MCTFILFYFFVDLTDIDGVCLFFIFKMYLYLIFVQCLLLNGKIIALGKIVMAGSYQYKDDHTLLL